MTLQHLPRIRVDKIDGNLVPEQATRAPRVLVVGTAGKGVGDQVYVATTTTQVKSEFGSEGNLTRGMWEAIKAGAEEVALYRIGATSAILEGVGDTAGLAGYTVATVEQDEDAGGNYSMYYDDTADRLVVRRNSDNLVVFDNDSTSPIDLFEIVVSGYRESAGGGDIGSASSFVNLEDIVVTGTTFTAGADGLSLSRMEIYEELYVAYKNLLQSDFDVIVPMDIYLDDYNVVNQGHFLGAVTPEIPGGQTHPTAGAFRPGDDVDSLGKVFVEEYEGEYYFWWDLDGDATAEIFPVGIGSSSATAKIDGTTLTVADFHEVNFGYQMGRFLYDYSSDIVDATGVFGALPPASNSLRDKARWLGKAPEWTQNSTTGEYTIATTGDDGSGLLGNKFMVGRNDHRAGVFGGGFILTDSEFMDGTELVDSNDIPIDLGKYLSVTVDTAWLRNNWYPAGYQASIAASYGGFYVGMPPFSAPTNKKVNNGIGLIYGFAIGALDNLAGAGYVSLRRKPQGLVIADAPTATMPNSDWRRLSTVRIVKDIIDGVRAAGERYLGESLGDAQKASLYSAVEKVLLAAKKIGSLKDYKPFQIIQTPSMSVNGEAEINLVLIPAFELRVINVPISLAKS
jgi:hypothetical protein